MSVVERLKKRLSNVPGVTDADIGMWVDEAVQESRLTEEDNANAIFYLALSYAYERIASDSARFFKYTDRDESVDKTNIFENYMKLADRAGLNYRKALRGGRGAFQTHPQRADGR